MIPGWAGRFDRAFQIVKESENNLLRAWKPLHDVLWTPYRASNPEAIPSAYAIFALTRGDFVQGIIAAANFGRILILWLHWWEHGVVPCTD